jgi:hypothetical protein
MSALPYPARTADAGPEQGEQRGEASEGEHPSARRLSWGVFLVSLSAFLLTASGRLLGQDQEYYYRMASAIALDRSFAVQPLVVGGTEASGARGPDGRFYTQYAPGLPLALAPVVLAGRLLAVPVALLGEPYGWQHQDLLDQGSRFLVSYFNAPITAATAALLALLVLRLGYPTPAASFVALAFALSSFAWGQARVVFAEPFQGFLLLLGCVTLLGTTSSRAPVGGLVLAVATLVKLTSVLALPALLLLPDRRGRPLWRTPATLGAVAGPVVGALLIHALYNIGRFGDVFTTAYTTSTGGLDFGGNPLIGIIGFLISPGRGLAWYAPPVIAAALAYRRFGRERPALGPALAALLIPWLVVHALYIDWSGGLGWGPRYLLPITPLILVPLAASWRDRRARLDALALAAIGILIEIPGATTDFLVVGRESLQMWSAICSSCGSALAYNRWHDFAPLASDIVLSTRALLAGSIDLAWVTFAGTWLAPTTLSVVVTLAVAGIALLRTELCRVTDRPHGAKQVTGSSTSHDRLV